MKKQRNKKKQSIKIVARKVESVDISQFCVEMMTPFIQNSNIARMFADASDGLKVVERRILYTLYYMLNVRLNEKDKHGKLYKVSKIVGDTLGQFHPHGESSIYSSIVNIVQDWKNYPALLYKGGNYGTIYGQDASASRYIATSLTDFCYDVYFREFNKETTDFRPNYSNNDYEPERLISALPMILIRGTSGIGTGIMSGVPPYNLREVVDLVIKLIKNPNIPDDEVWLVPDFPVQCEILDTNFKDICIKGEGVINTRAIIVDSPNGKDLDIISYPYKVRTDDIIKKIQKLNKDNNHFIKSIKNINRIPQLKKYDDGKYNLDIHRVILEKGTNKERMKSFLYKSCGLKSDFAVNFNLIDDYQVIHYNLKSYILTWLDYRREQKTRNMISQLKQKIKECHTREVVLEILSLPSFDKIIDKISRESLNKKDMIEKLQKKFNITDLQADVIAKFRQYERTKESLKEYKKQFEDLKNQIDMLNNKVQNIESIDNEIIDELKYFKKKYGKDRFSYVVSDDSKDSKEIEVSVIITKNGLIKVTSDSSDSALLRITENNDDRIVYMNKDILNTTKIIIFTNEKAYTIQLSDFPLLNRRDMGINLSDVLKMKTSEKVINVIVVPKNEKKHNKKVVLLSSKGLIKQSEISNWAKINKVGTVSMKIDKDDNIVSVTLINNNDLLLYTRDGKGLRIENNITTTLKTSGGIQGINTDEALGCIEIDKKSEYLLILTNKGIKKIKQNDLVNKKRGGKGISIIGLSKDEYIEDIVNYNDDDDVSLKCYKFTSHDIIDIPDFNLSELKYSTKIAKAEKLKLNKANIILL